jgi:hypothetical protein
MVNRSLMGERPLESDAAKAQRICRAASGTHHEYGSSGAGLRGLSLLNIGNSPAHGQNARLVGGPQSYPNFKLRFEHWICQLIRWMIAIREDYVMALFKRVNLVIFSRRTTSTSPAFKGSGSMLHGGNGPQADSHKHAQSSPRRSHRKSMFRKLARVARGKRVVP